MIDCSNVEMRDRLPDLANETLGAVERELVLAHLAGCAECTAEIEILRTTRLILVTSTPKVNVQGIVSALPQYGVRGVGTAPSARRSGWTNSWRAAAAVTFLAASFGSYELLNRAPASRVVDTAIAATADTTVGLALTGALADMSDAELSALVTDIDKIEALPSTEVESISAVNGPAILPDSIVRELEDR